VRLGSNTLSNAEARRIALAAQGFAGRPKDSRPNWTRVENAILKMNLLQIDSVNVLVRSHYLPVFSRIGPYSRETLDRRSFDNRTRRLFEYWAHEASLLQQAHHPYMRWRMARAAAGEGIYKGLTRFGREEKTYVASVLDHVRVNGPTAASELPDAGGRSGKWWGWSKGKAAIEYLFDPGELRAGTRVKFERLYDLPERVIPPETLARATPPEEEAVAALIDMSGRALGVAAETDLRDYFRLPVDAFKAALPKVVEAGRLIPVIIEGWRPRAYIHADAQLPRQSNASALLSPFDPLVWDRDRTERLFHFRYRIEIYTPAHKRTYGYYVLPFLHRGAIAARICLKSDRTAAVLRANRAHLEHNADPSETAEALAGELDRMARWLGLDGVEVSPSGDLAPLLAQAMKSVRGEAARCDPEP
jgi:uncharacterized protein YcaQ